METTTNKRTREEVKAWLGRAKARKAAREKEIRALWEANQQQKQWRRK